MTTQTQASSGSGSTYAGQWLSALMGEEECNIDPTAATPADISHLTAHMQHLDPTIGEADVAAMVAAVAATR